MGHIKARHPVAILASLGLCLLAGSMTLSCDFQLFKNVQIKANPTIYAPLGDTSYELSTLISSEQLTDMIGTSSGATIYDYAPAGSDVMSFLVHYPIASVDVDFSSYLANIDLGADLDQAIEGLAFTVPAFTVPAQSDSVSVTFGSDLLAEVNGEIVTQTATIAEPGPLSGSFEIPFTIELTKVTSVSFSAGYMDLTLGLTGNSADLVLTLDSVELLDGTTLLTSATIPVGGTPIPATGATITVSLPLTGAQFVDGMTLRLGASASGGTAGVTPILNVTPAMRAGTTISGASGIALTYDIAVPPIVIDTDFASASTEATFVRAVVGTGSIVFTMDPLPTGWTGFTRTVNLTIAQTDGLSISDSFTTDSRTIDLAAETVNGNDITITASVSISATAATITSLDPAGETFNYSAITSLTNLSSLVIQPTTPLDLSVTISEPLPADITDWVDQIVFDEIGARFSFINGLPIGNDLTLTASSTAFGIASTATALPAGATTTTTTQYTSAPFTFIPSATTPIDFTVTLGMTGYDEVANELTLNNISPGAVLSFSGTIEIVSDWNNATISPGASGYSGTFPADGSTIDLSPITDYIPAEVTIPTLPMYLYINGLSSLGATGTAMTVSATYTGAATTPVYLAGNATAGAAIVDAVGPDFTLNADGAVTSLPANDSVTGDIDLADILNARPADLALAYDLDVGTLTVYEADVAAGATIDVDLVVVLPLQFAVPASGANINLSSVISDGSSDLFGRTEVSTDETINTLLDSLVSLDLNAHLVNNTGMALSATLTGVGTTFSKTFTLETGTTDRTISLTAEEIRLVMDTVPFVPQLVVTIPYRAAPYGLQRDGSISALLSVQAVTDFEYTYTIGEEN